jgi:CubicO group peptidase (beta-lactamase class C family)
MVTLSSSNPHQIEPRVDWSPEVCELLAREVVRPGGAPGGVAAVGLWTDSGLSAWVGASGRLRRGLGARVERDTPFDLASLTKSFVAAIAVRLAADGALSLGAPIGQLLPAVAGTRVGRVSVESLLAHRSGLAAHIPLFDTLMAKKPIEREALLRRVGDALGHEPPGAPLYSDLGYILAGEALSATTGLALDELLEREVCTPLSLRAGSARQLGARETTFVARVAPTEIVPWRGGELCGLVHDENAWSLAGHGLAGHAGLFGTAEDVLRFGAAMLQALGGGSSWLSAEAAEAMVRARPGGSPRMGFDSPSGQRSAAGQDAEPDTFGHLGFTGTSFWCDPNAGRITVLLTHRVHPTRDTPPLRPVRARVHDALRRLPAPPRRCS